MFGKLLFGLFFAAAMGERTLPPATSAPSADPVASALQAISKRVTYSVSWDASAITCDNGATFAASAIPTRIPARSAREPETKARVAYSFQLGSEGRPLSVEIVGHAGRPFLGSDLAPALAAAQLLAQREITACKVTFTQTAIPLDEAPLENLVMTRVFDRRLRIPNEAWQRFAPGGCHKQRTHVLEWHTPDFRKLPKSPGAPHWTFQTYNIAGDGTTERVETIGSSGSVALNEANNAATRASRFIDGDPREGCWRYTWTSADVIEAPEAKPLSDYGEMPEACDVDDKWSREPKLTYPEVYRRRGLEGWVVFKFDVAPWGEIGNIEVVDAQPTRDLAEYARSVLTSGKYKPREGGLSGCLERIVFALPEKPANPEPN